MDKKQLLDLICDRKVIQIASTVNNNPWIASVYFVVDSELNLYWLSFPARRHSKELSINPHAAIAITVKEDMPVIGVQFEGEVDIVNQHKQVQSVMVAYIKKYGLGKDYYANFISDKNQHVLYRFKPKRVVVFDEVNNHANPRLEVAL